MRWSNTNFRRSLATLWLAVLLGVFPLFTAARPLTQDAVGQPNAPSPAQGHVAVIAHGVEQFQAREVAWQITAERAALPSRSMAIYRPPGFVLADAGVVAVAERNGFLLARVAPGKRTGFRQIGRPPLSALSSGQPPTSRSPSCRRPTSQTRMLAREPRLHASAQCHV